MYDLYLTLRSVTPAQRGRSVLERAGLACAMLRAPREIAPGGCAYALALRARDGRRAAELLDRADIAVEGRWLRRPEGFVRLER